MRTLQLLLKVASIYSYGTSKDLPSFPTRRSSDLGDAAGLLSAAAPEFEHQQGPEPSGIVAAPRSEEHTSELQSRPHLVCRLLLEKKKNTGRSTRSLPEDYRLT